MSFFTVNTHTIRKSSIVFFIIMVISWALMFLLAPFGANESIAGPGAGVPVGILALIYLAAFVSPLATAVYSWFWVFSREAASSRIVGLIFAVIASGLCAYAVVWAMH